MRWAVEIQKFGLKEKNLADLLAGLGYQLIDGIEYPAFISQSLEECGTASDVWVMAKHLRKAFTGPSQIDPTFTLGAIIDYLTEGPKRYHFLEASDVIYVSALAKASITVVPPACMSSSELAEWHREREEDQYQAQLEEQRALLEPAFWSERASKVMALLNSRVSTGETVFKVYELMEGHPEQRIAFQREFGVTKMEFDRFKDAVHNPVVTGEWARHAYEDKPRSTNPMTIHEAEQFVRVLAKRWLARVRITKS